MNCQKSCVSYTRTLFSRMGFGAIMSLMVRLKRLKSRERDLPGYVRMTDSDTRAHAARWFDRNYVNLLKGVTSIVE